MKKNKIIGIALIICSLVVQVGYALETNAVLTNTEQFDVEISNMTYRTQSRNVDIDIANVKGTVVDIAVNQMYPGAQYEIATEIANNGEESAKITDIEISVVEGQSSNAYRLFDYIVGIDGQGKEIDTEAYEIYLRTQYVDKLLKPGETLEVRYHMGLSEALTDLENEIVEYNINITLEQSTTPSGGGSGSNSGSNSNASGDLSDDVEIEDDKVPAGPVLGIEQEEIIIEDDNVPAGAVGVKSEDTIIEDEVLPGGSAFDNVDTGTGEYVEVLPKTGGIPAIFIYLIGCMVLVTGIGVYKKVD